MNKNKIIFLLLPLLLVACSDNNSDLKQWMNEQDKTMVKRVDPLPSVETYVPSKFDNKDVNPFQPRMAILQSAESSKLAPDLNRRKEPLEAFPLLQLHMVGTFEINGRLVALVKASDGMVYNVGVGNYLGQSFGKVMEINDNKVIIREVTQDSGQWQERMTELDLEEGSVKK
jgi:type IV pilus assembly protein PilP